MEIAYFGAGCFWHVQHEFDKINGVVSTYAGFMGDDSYDNLTYEQVHREHTGHAEVVKVEFDENVVSYEELLDFFWKIHDPTQLNKQGADIGEEYRSVIFYTSDEQRVEAIHSMEKIQSKFDESIVTLIEKAERFYQASDEHQHYLN